MSIWTHTEMNGMPVEAQAARAILYTLQRIRDDGTVGWYLSVGTRTFDLLTEAYATLSGLKVEDVRREYACLDPVNPRKEVDDGQG